MGKYKAKLEERLIKDCETITDLIEVNILQKGPPDETKAFFLKTAADYHRYIAEIATGDRLN